MTQPAVFDSDLDLLFVHPPEPVGFGEWPFSLFSFRTCDRNGSMTREEIKKGWTNSRGNTPKPTMSRLKPELEELN